MEYFSSNYYKPRQLNSQDQLFLLKLINSTNLMDPKVREVIQTTINKSNDLLRSLEPYVEAKMATVIQTCFSKNSSNSDRFADCLVEKNKKTQEIMKSVEFKILFLSKAANVCLNNKRSVSECTQQATKSLKQIIDSTKKNIQRI